MTGQLRGSRPCGQTAAGRAELWTPSLSRPWRRSRSCRHFGRLGRERSAGLIEAETLGVLALTP